MSQNAKRQTKKAPNKNLKLFGALLGIIVVAVATAMLIFNPFKSEYLSTKQGRKRVFSQALCRFKGY